MLEKVFSPAHPLHDRILYDPQEGSYYDAHTDLYLTLQEVRAFGLPV